FYLNLDEVLHPTQVDQTLKEIVVKRKKQYSTYSEVRPPSHFVTLNRTPPLIPNTHSLQSDLIQAKPASSGKIRGRVKIFKDFFLPSKIDFEIMVTSHTDPGWTPLIALSKGLIIEHGGVLSHASIVARELGIPTVIGALGATTTFRDGQVVEIDGSNGMIKLLI
ncbi:MAG: PEP-utilizing enzyme, partial [Candidatus Paceibacterota bacterium]